MADNSENLYLDIDYVGPSLFISLSLSNVISYSDLKTFITYTKHELDSVNNSSAYFQLDVSDLKSISVFGFLSFFIFNLKHARKFNKLSVIESSHLPLLLKWSISPFKTNMQYFNDIAPAKAWLND